MVGIEVIVQTSKLFRKLPVQCDVNDTGNETGGVHMLMVGCT
jgi:hypothetical protein